MKTSESQNIIHGVCCSRCWVHWAGLCWALTRLIDWRMTILCCTKFWWTSTPTTACSSPAHRCRTASKNSGHCCSSSCHSGTWHASTLSLPRHRHVTQAHATQVSRHTGTYRYESRHGIAECLLLAPVVAAMVFAVWFILPYGLFHHCSSLTILCCVPLLTLLEGTRTTFGHYVSTMWLIHVYLRYWRLRTGMKGPTPLRSRVQQWIKRGWGQSVVCSGWVSSLSVLLCSDTVGWVAGTASGL